MVQWAGRGVLIQITVVSGRASDLEWSCTTLVYKSIDRHRILEKWMVTINELEFYFLIGFCFDCHLSWHWVPFLWSIKITSKIAIDKTHCALSMKIALKKFRLIMTVASVTLCLINEAFPFLALFVITRAAQQFAKKAVYQNVRKSEVQMFIFISGPVPSYT